VKQTEHSGAGEFDNMSNEELEAFVNADVEPEPTHEGTGAKH
jgi:hypothetical protein